MQTKLVSKTANLTSMENFWMEIIKRCTDSTMKEIQLVFNVSYSSRIDLFELLLRWQSLVGIVERIFPDYPTRCRTHKRREIFLCEVGCRIYVNLRHILLTSMRKTRTIVDVHSIVSTQLHFNYPRTCVNVSSAGECRRDAMMPLGEKNSFAFPPCGQLKKSYSERVYMSL